MLPECACGQEFAPCVRECAGGVESHARFAQGAENRKAYFGSLRGMAALREVYFAMRRARSARRYQPACEWRFLSRGTPCNTGCSNAAARAEWRSSTG